VASRLLRGDQESAKNYLARQASLSPGEADARIAQVKAKADAAIAKAKETAAIALKGAGWTVFLLIFLGMFGACVGGLLGTKANERYTLDMSHEEVLHARATSLKNIQS
jgi:hypothetical protein